jgi:hypothetical protein
MKKSFLKTSYSEVATVIDKETGEILDVTINKTSYLANTKEDFYLMYSSMVLILKGSTDVKMKLFAALLERYSQGQEFSMSKGLKEIIASETGCKPRSLDSAFTELVKNNVIVRINTQLYKVNPRHVFRGSTSTRNNELKALIELGCKDC